MDERKAAILRAIVEDYIGTGQPVGSARIAATRDLGVSAATVRNDMTLLEREGYIAQPHTSAGRIPTDQGYRYFVDHFAGAGALNTEQRREIAEFFTTATRAMEDLLFETSQLLARTAGHASVVVGPQVEAARIRAVQVVVLQPTVALVIAVLSNGSLERATIRLEAEPDHDTVHAATARLEATLVGATLAGFDAPPDTGRPELDALVAAACAALRDERESASEPVFVGGAHRLAAEQEAFPGAAERTTKLLELLEEHVVLVSIIRELLGPGVTVRIGSENEVDDLRECSLVLAPYLVEGEPAGTIGVLGPTRMDYRQALSAVGTVSQLLGRTLST